MKGDKALWFYGPAAGMVAADQLTKFAARAGLEPDRPVRVIPGFFDLNLSYNTGGAFGVLPDWAPLFIIVALVAVFAIVRLGRATGGSRPLALGLGLLMGGAIGNLIDRLTAPNHKVTDFLSLHVTIGGQRYAWPTFNAADVGIVAGAATVFFCVYVIEKRKRDSESE